MSDAEIIFPKGKEALAERLREAIGRAGYEADLGEGVDADDWPTAGGAAAVLILWDRATMAHPGLQAVAADARQAGRALDISTDGITPRGFRDESRLIQLSGWRGEPFHPGWKRILAELQRLCGGERKAVPPLPAATGQATDAPAGESSARPRGDRGGISGKVLSGFVVALVLVAALAGFLLLPRHSAPVEPARRPVAPAVVTAPPKAPPPRTGAPAPSAAAPAAGGGAGQPLASAAATNAVSAEPEKPAASPPPAPKPAKAKKARHEPKPKIHYTKYAKTMRLFCERSGRDTPECRLFMRETRGRKP
jgi:hypothetical protein